MNNKRGISMGFSLGVFFDDLIQIIESDSKPKKKWALLVKCIYDARKYAKECGQLRND